MKNQVNEKQNPSSIEHGGERQSVALLRDALQTAQMLITEYRLAFDDYGLFLGADNKRVDAIIRNALDLSYKPETSEAATADATPEQSDV